MHKNNHHRQQSTFARKRLDQSTFVGSRRLSVLCELEMRRSMICINALQKELKTTLILRKLVIEKLF